VYLRSIEALGVLRDQGSIDLLKNALYQGQWWAPFRTARLRSTVATALQRIGTPAALTVLEEAATRGPRGVRAAARARIEATAPSTPDEPKTDD
jgi:HEAT repeat protein